ncbi:efflux RND transporter periplasmic adaptor subunit [Endozoicomonadaceae bacterium StTr2]
MTLLKALLFAPSSWLLLLTVLLVSPALQAEQFEARALINAIERAVLSAELSARVDNLPKRPGERFRKGDLLVALDCDLYQAQTDKVVAENKAAKARYDNARKLNKLRSIGAMDVAMSQYAWEQTEAELTIARLNTRRCEIRAPFDGQVVTLAANQHEYIHSQQEVIEIIADRRLEVEVVAPAQWLRWLKNGYPFHLRIDETGATLNAEIISISPAIDPVSQTVVLRAGLEAASGLIPGMSATAYFEVKAMD